MQKPVLMIHEVREWMFELPLENYILTFDDGLYSQYYYFDKFKAIDTPKIFFISTDIVCEGEQSNTFPACYVAHDRYRNGIKSDYMTIEQIIEIMQDPNSSIGGHSHTHTPLENFRLQQAYQHMKHDTELMLEWFDTKLNHKPKQFCFPYNRDFGGLYRTILKEYGFTEFYGSERIAIESLLNVVN